MKKDYIKILLNSIYDSWVYDLFIGPLVPIGAILLLGFFYIILSLIWGAWDYLDNHPIKIRPLHEGRIWGTVRRIWGRIRGAWSRAGLKKYKLEKPKKIEKKDPIKKEEKPVRIHEGIEAGILHREKEKDPEE